MACRLESVKDAWRGRLQASGGRFIEAWVTGPFTRLYGITRGSRWLDHGRRCRLREGGADGLNALAFNQWITGGFGHRDLMVNGYAMNVPLKFPNGEVKSVRFSPLCFNTSNLTLCETPLVFRAEDS